MRLAAMVPVLMLALAATQAALAQGGAPLPRWEAGVAAGGGWVADYPGADQSHARGLATPWLIYRGDVLRIDRDGVRGRLFDHPDVELDITASAAFNARDSDARDGMPGLDYLFGVGPQLVYKGLRDAPGRPTLHLKLRGAASTDFRGVDRRGATLSAEARWRFAAGPQARWSVEAEPIWASRGLQRYFYEVAPAHATAARPAYRARGGYLGTELGVSYLRRVDADLSWFAGVNLLSLRGAANADSPLLRHDVNASLGVGLVWTPWRSRASAASADD
jgi:outer membrane protein